MKPTVRIATRTLAGLALLLALEVVLTRFLSIQTPILRIGFAFLPIAVAGFLYGPVAASLMAALADILGMLLFPSGTFFPGFTASALVQGAVYGLFLHRRRATWLRVLAVSLALAVVVDLGMNTVWLSMLYAKAVAVLLPARLLKTAVMLPVQVLMIRGTLEALVRTGIAPSPKTEASKTEAAKTL
jgi:ECF transporter S component (folate family)